MIRRIIHIDKEKCNGCGACVNACLEGAIGLDAEGKAELLRDDYCDGLGDCLPGCPTGAITFTEREAAVYDEEAVKKNLAAKKPRAEHFSGCPGTRMRFAPRAAHPAPAEKSAEGGFSLETWPIQIKLAPVNAPFFRSSSLLIAADCTAFAYSGIHALEEGRVVLIGCPKLDSVDYTEKLAEILRSNTIRDITVVRMEVPCCGGLENAVKAAVKLSGRVIPCAVITVGIDGGIVR